MFSDYSRQEFSTIDALGGRSTSNRNSVSIGPLSSAFRVRRILFLPYCGVNPRSFHCEGNGLVLCGLFGLVIL